MQTSETISRSFTRSCHGVGHDKNLSKYWTFWLLLFFWFSRCSFGASCFLHGALPKESEYCCSCFFPSFFAGPSAWPSLKSLKILCVFSQGFFFNEFKDPKTSGKIFFLLFKFGVPRTCGCANVLHLGCVF